MCLAQGHNAVTPMRLDSAATRSRVKHSTTEPLRSPKHVNMTRMRHTHIPQTKLWHPGTYRASQDTCIKAKIQLPDQPALSSLAR